MFDILATHPLIRMVKFVFDPYFAIRVGILPPMASSGVFIRSNVRPDKPPYELYEVRHSQARVCFKWSRLK
jgi:hypothetical protein